MPIANSTGTRRGFSVPAARGVPFVCVALLIAACGGNPTPTPIVGVPDASPAAASPVAPQATGEPLAARVNGEPITQAELEQEIARYEAAQASQGADLAALGDYRSTVLTMLVEQKVIEQAAVAAGHAVSDDEVEAQIQSIVTSLGSSQAFADYLAANGYTEAQFRRSLKSQLLSSKITEQVAGQVPENAEQAHARHILVDTEAQAADLLSQLQSGADFATLATNYSRDPSSRVAGGDLGWFPRGWLTVPEVEQAAFELPLGQISGVIHSALGYHIVEPLERETRPLAPDTLQAVRLRAVQDWVSAQVAGATVEILVAP